jgi:hypothetical protein
VQVNLRASAEALRGAHLAQWRARGKTGQIKKRGNAGRGGGGGYGARPELAENRTKREKWTIRRSKPDGRWSATCRLSRRQGRGRAALARGAGGTGGIGADGGAGGDLSLNGEDAQGYSAGGDGGGRDGLRGLGGAWSIKFTYTVNAGYKVFITKDRPWQAGDVPLATLASDVTQYVVDTAGLGLTANAPYYFSVLAFNVSGLSDPLSKRMVTDGSGVPEIRPSLVKNLRVHPEAGGRAIAEWEYDEADGDPLADAFGIEVVSLDGGSPIVVADVPLAGRNYRVSFSGADGNYRVYVRAKLAGVYESATTGMDVRIDGTPPVGTLPALSAF